MNNPPKNNFPQYNYANSNYYQKARSSNIMNSPIDQTELSKAQHALQSLKAKMGSAPRRPVINIGSSQGPRRFIPTFDIDNQMMQRGPIHTNSNIPSQNISLGAPSNAINNNEFNININRNAKPQFASPNYRPSFNNVPKTTSTNRRPVIAKNNFNNVFNGANANAYEQNDERALDLNGSGMKEKERINPEKGEPTFPCPDCGRSFTQATLEKHARICKKVFQNKRKAFDSQASRVSDPEQATLMKKGEMKMQIKMNSNNVNANKQKNADKEPKWKKQSEEFRNIIHGKATNVPSVLTDDYTLCQYCNRKYNEQAYNKHLEGCKRRFHEAQFKNKGKSVQGNANTNNNNQGFHKVKYRSGK